MYELKRGTGIRNGARGRFPGYSAKRGQKNYEISRSKCHKPHALEVLIEELSEDVFREIFKTIISDNGTEFERLSELTSYCIGVYFYSGLRTR